MEVRQGQDLGPGDVGLETVRPWALWQTEVARRRGPQCARREVRWRAWASLRGLRSPVERKNGWQLAEVNGDTTPYGVQHVLGRAVWEADALRDDGRPDVVEHLGAPDAVLVVEETGLLTQGQQSAGVARQESGTAGRVDHGHLGVCLPSASLHGHGLLARARSLPTAWASDEARCARAGIPAARTLATQPQLAPHRRKRACDAGVPAAGVAGDSVEGEQRALRTWVEEHDHADVLAISGQAYLWRAGRQPPVPTILATRAPAGWDR